MMSDAEENESLSESGPSIQKTAESDEKKPLETLSKSKLKKMKRKEKWEQVKAEKRKKEKERAKARKRELREKGELGPTRKQLKYNTMNKSDCKIQVAIDCSFDEYMSEKDIKMLVKQIQFSYSANRRATSPLQFYCCGIGGKTKERLESLGDYKGWDINFREESYEKMFEKSSIIYLSSESPNVLQTLEEDKVYVIGGLVDHNHQKGLCHKLAVEKGLHHAQLPIAEVLDMKTRKVLTINHVFEILLHYTETKDWQKAFYTVIPPRKGAILKTKEDSSDISEDSEKSDADEVNNKITLDSCSLSVDKSGPDRVDSSSLDKVDHSGLDKVDCLDKVDSSGLGKVEPDHTDKHHDLSSDGTNRTDTASYTTKKETSSADR